MMDETETKNPAEPDSQPQGLSKKWLWSLPLVGICVLFFCLTAALGLFLWPSPAFDVTEKR